MEIEELVPQLRTTDLKRAIHFYTGKLGFVLAFRHQDFYAGVSSGDRMIHLKLVDDPDPGITFTSMLACATSMPLSGRFRKLA